MQGLARRPVERGVFRGSVVDRGESVNLPVGVQSGIATSVGGQSVKWSINSEYNLRDRDGLPEGSVRFGLSLLVPGG